MDRPYKVDEVRVAHIKPCHSAGPTNSDCNKEGLVEGMVEDGYGICRRCIDKDTRVELFEESAEYTDLLMSE